MSFDDNGLYLDVLDVTTTVLNTDPPTVLNYIITTYEGLTINVGSLPRIIIVFNNNINGTIYNDFVGYTSDLSNNKIYILKNIYFEKYIRSIE